MPKLWHLQKHEGHALLLSRTKRLPAAFRGQKQFSGLLLCRPRAGAPLRVLRVEARDVARVLGGLPALADGTHFLRRPWTPHVGLPATGRCRRWEDHHCPQPSLMPLSQSPGLRWPQRQLPFKISRCWELQHQLGGDKQGTPVPSHPGPSSATQRLCFKGSDNFGQPQQVFGF